MAIDRQESPYRRGNRYPQLPIPMVTEHCIPVDAGAVQLVVESRKLTNEIINAAYRRRADSPIPFDDFGATLHVCGTADGLEYLRFDCFENEPHYHYIEQAKGANTVVRIDELAVGDPDRLLARLRRAPPSRHAPALRCRRTGRHGRRPTRKVDAAVAEVRELMEKARYPVA